MSLMKLKSFWNDMNERNWDKLARYFWPKAEIEWPNTGERFTVDDFVKVNSEYPGTWDIELQRIEQCGTTLISVALVKEHDGDQSLFVASFFEFDGDLILKLIEYWSENGEPPEWRRGLNV